MYLAWFPSSCAETLVTRSLERVSRVLRELNDAMSSRCRIGARRLLSGRGQTAKRGPYGVHGSGARLRDGSDFFPPWRRDSASGCRGASVRYGTVAPTGACARRTTPSNMTSAASASEFTFRGSICALLRLAVADGFYSWVGSGGRRTTWNNVVAPLGSTTQELYGIDVGTRDSDLNPAWRCAVTGLAAPHIFMRA